MKSKKQSIKELKRKFKISLVKIGRYKDAPVTKDDLIKFFKEVANVFEIYNQLRIVSSTPVYKRKLQKGSRAIVGEESNEVVVTPKGMALVPEINKHGVMRIIPRCIQKEKPS